MYTLVDTDSDGEDLDSVLASAPLRRYQHTSVAVTQQHSTSTSTLRTEHRTFSTTTTTTTTTSRRSGTVPSSRSILSVLDENDWDKQPAPAVSAEPPEPRKKRRKTGSTSGEDGVTAQIKALERAAEKEERERRKLQEKQDRQLARDEAKVRHFPSLADPQAAKEAERSYQKKLKEVNRVSWCHHISLTSAT